jgi:hypothetical protein
MYDTDRYLGSARTMSTHLIRSLCTALLLLLIFAVLSYLLMSVQYEDLLQTFSSQGERAYVIAFIQLFLNDLISSAAIVIFVLVAFLISILFLKSWTDGILMGLLLGVTVALLAFYITKNYFPGELAAGWLPVLYENLRSGFLMGLILGSAGALGGLAKQKIISARINRKVADIASEKSFYKCPKCGTIYESNPEFCSNCGHRLRRNTQS